MWHQAVIEKDPIATQLMAEYFDLVATGILNVAYLLNPEAFILDEWTAHCPEVTVEIVKRKLAYYRVMYDENTPRVLSSKCSDRDLPGSVAVLALNSLWKKLSEKE